MVTSLLLLQGSVSRRVSCEVDDAGGPPEFFLRMKALPGWLADRCT